MSGPPKPHEVCHLQMFLALLLKSCAFRIVGVVMAGRTLQMHSASLLALHFSDGCRASLAQGCCRLVLITSIARLYSTPARESKDSVLGELSELNFGMHRVDMV